MKTQKGFFTRHAVALTIAGILGSFMLQAQENPPGERRERPAGDRGAGRGGFVQLDEKQRELLREANQKNEEQIRKLDEKLRAAQKELVQAVIAEKYDEAKVKEKAEAVGKVQTEITVLRAKAFSSLAPSLKPEQREQLENSRFGAAMLMGGFGGGGPGGREGAPGGDRPRRREGN